MSRIYAGSYSDRLLVDGCWRHAPSDGLTSAFAKRIIQLDKRLERIGVEAGLPQLALVAACRDEKVLGAWPYLTMLMDGLDATQWGPLLHGRWLHAIAPSSFVAHFFKRIRFARSAKRPDEVGINRLNNVKAYADLNRP